MISIDEIVNKVLENQKSEFINYKNRLNIQSKNNKLENIKEDNNENVNEIINKNGKKYKKSDIKSFNLSVINSNYIYSTFGYKNIYEAIFLIIDKDFYIKTESEKIETINEIRKSMAFSLDTDKLYTKLGYSHNKNMVKNKIKQDLLAIDKINFENDVIRYIVDYFNINLIINNCDLVDTNGNIEIFKNNLSKDKPIIIIKKILNNYYPLMNDTNSLITIDNNLYKILYYKYIFNEEIKEEYNKYKLKELKEECEKLNIELQKKSEKTGKMINKNKNDLIEDIYFNKIDL